MPDSTYVGPIMLTGDMIASMTGQPTQTGNPGDANFAMNLSNVTALGTSNDLYRLNWYQNTNTTATNFANGQRWRLEQYNPLNDPDGNPATGNDGWSTVPGDNNLTPKHDLVSGLGAGDDYIVFSRPNGSHLLYDLNGGLPTTPTNLVYSGVDENGDPLVGDNDGQLDFSDSYDAISAVCFAAGTFIKTDAGDVPIETLKAGDLVFTRDNGFQVLRWVGGRKLSNLELAVAPHLRPIKITAGSLGADTPSADLFVSPQHRILVRSKIAQRMFGKDEILIAAKHLTDIPGIEISAAPKGVEYFHMLFDRHEIVVANATESESLYTGQQTLKTLSKDAKQEIFSLFPELQNFDPARLPESARTIASGRMGRNLAKRHVKNHRFLLAG